MEPRAGFAEPGAGEAELASWFAPRGLSRAPRACSLTGSAGAARLLTPKGGVERLLCLGRIVAEQTLGPYPTAVLRPGMRHPSGVPSGTVTPVLCWMRREPVRTRLTTRDERPFRPAPGLAGRPARRRMIIEASR
mgnify:CR=1 FL=1